MRAVNPNAAEGFSRLQFHVNSADPVDSIQTDLDRFADDGNPNNPEE